MKKRGPSSYSWVIPLLTFIHSEWFPNRKTLCSLSLSQSSIQLNISPVIALIFIIKRLWFTLSKDFWKCRWITSIGFSWSIKLDTYSGTSNEFVRHDHVFKIHAVILSYGCIFMWSIMLPLIIVSNTLQTWEVKLTGLYSNDDHLSPSWKINVTFAFSVTMNYMPLSKNSLYKQLRNTWYISIFHYNSENQSIYTRSLIYFSLLFSDDIISCVISVLFSI